MNIRYFLATTAWRPPFQHEVIQEPIHLLLRQVLHVLQDPIDDLLLLGAPARAACLVEDC